MRERDPHLLPLYLSAILAALFGVLAIAQTDSWWVAGAAVGALILLVLAIVLDVTGSTQSDAFERVLVVTSEPLPAKQVLDAVARQTGSTPSAAELGVMVVSPEGWAAGPPAGRGGNRGLPTASVGEGDGAGGRSRPGTGGRRRTRPLPDRPRSRLRAPA